MQVFRKNKAQLSSAASERLQKLLGSRTAPLGGAESEQMLVTPPPQAIRPILKIVIAVVLLTAGLVWLNRPTPVSVPEVASPGIPISTNSNSPVPVQGIDQIVVDVKGDVLTPGLVTLPAGARVADAIAAAGGISPNANVTSLNLAERLSDGQMVIIGNSQSQPASSDPRINLNLATESELDSLPGVGPVMAGRIIAWRETNHKFHSIEELQEVPGIGPKVFANLKSLVRI
ncbi:MAG: ComEA family DNA-binding protein [Actinobacteria bacterium]|nr:ComEA family DNA-binding protein [Actinomycetota bacterium]